MSREALARVLILAGVMTGQSPALVTAQHNDASPIPLVPGLTITAIIASPVGDAEVILSVQSVDPEAYRMTFSAEFPHPSGRGTETSTAVRTVLMQDQRTARTMRNWYASEDPEVFSGTTPFFSGAIINDLRNSGRAALTLLVAASAASLGQTEVLELPGTVSRIESTPVPVPVLVNGRLVELPTIHARAEVGRASVKRGADLNVLDDPRNPIILRWRDEMRNSKIMKIDFPVARGLERELSEHRSAEVYGIYFSFGSAGIRPESERVLEEIADVLQRNPDWKLRIDGHTDAMGTDAANLELSKRRSEAVRDALITRHRIAARRLSAAGSGEASPKATNDTPEGRAQNRRVELTRQ
jgi:outer membrane protein OmpA-like peptidoglycan-associated protein